MSEWISIKDKPLPCPEKYITGFTLPAISRLYGYGVIQKTFMGGWCFTKNHKNCGSLNTVTHWMPLPDEMEIDK